MNTPQQLGPPSSQAPPAPKAGVLGQRRLFWLTLSALAACLLAGGAWYGWKHLPRATQSPSEAAVHWHEAQVAEQQHEYARAREELTACLAVWPLNAETNFLMARVCRQRKDLSAWSDYVERASQLQWPQDQINLEESLKQAQLGKLSSLQRPLLAYADRRPEQAPLVYEALAEGYLINQRHRELWELAAGWKTRFPNDWLAYRYLGDAFNLDGGADKAVVEYQHALERAPDPDLVRPYLASAIMGAGKHQEALTLYEAYLKAHPHDPTALFGLALCQNAVGNESAARQALTETLRYQPDNVDALVLQGKLDVADGNPKAAAAELQRAEKLAPWRVDILHNLASALQDLHHDRQAEEYRQKEKRVANQVRQLDTLKKELHTKPRDVAIRYQIAELNRRMGDMKEAMLWYTGVLAIDPKHTASRKALEDYLRQTTRPESISHSGRP